jgi:hypothetical protein
MSARCSQVALRAATPPVAPPDVPSHTNAGGRAATPTRGPAPPVPPRTQTRGVRATTPARGLPPPPPVPAPRTNAGNNARPWSPTPSTPSHKRGGASNYAHPWPTPQRPLARSRISALLVDVVLHGQAAHDLVDHVESRIRDSLSWSHHTTSRNDLTAAETVQLNDRRLSTDAIETGEPLEDAPSEGGIREIKDSVADSCEIPSLSIPTTN